MVDRKTSSRDPRPSHPGGVLQKAKALRIEGRHEAALAFLAPYDAGPTEKPLWARELTEAALSCGDRAMAAHGLAAMITSAAQDAALMSAGLALAESRLPDAERMVRARLRDYPADVVAIRLMAELATRIGRMDDAERLLQRALGLAPTYPAARELLARNLQRQNRFEDALAEVALLVDADPDNPSLLLLQASLLVKVGDQAGARDIYRLVLKRHPRQAKGWMSLGHVLKTLGDQEGGVAAYRRAIDEQPSLGEAWWSLANLKTFAFSDGDIAAMTRALSGLGEDERHDEDRLHLHFAFGKAQEDRHAFQDAFGHWLVANRLRRKSLPYDAGQTHRDCKVAVACFDGARLADGMGSQAIGPIFVVGLPRSGSTLVEQILASHSQVEGTMELPDMMAIAARLRGDAGPAEWLGKLSTLTPAERAVLGEEYLARTQVHRREGRPFFIDKMPNNWMHVGLIRMILPHARIVDARRDAADCCLSAFKQHFARGQSFSNDLADLGRYYRDYADLMDHFDRAAPGMVHRVVYERMVQDTEAEVRRLLAYCGLPFEPDCLSFWKNDRAVRTASSEQVRQPIFTRGVGHWRNFAPWLGPLFEALGPELAPRDA